MRTKSLLAVGRLLSSGMQSSSFWSLIMAICHDANANPARPASGHEHKNAMPWLKNETQFACEFCGNLVTLEKAKLRDDERLAQMLQEVSQSRRRDLREGAQAAVAAS